MLDIAISLGLVYLMMAAMVSGVQELLSSSFQWRGKQMQRGIASLLDETMTATAVPGGLVDSVMKHPIIDALRDKDRRPAYIPAAHFAVALADELVRKYGIARPLFQGLPEAVKRLPEGDLKRTLQTLVAQSGGQPVQLQALVESHFNLVMDRVSGWYKRRAQYVAFGLALAFAVGFNVDTLALVRHLTKHPEVAAKMAVQAGELVKSEESKKLTGRDTPPADPADPAAAVARASATLSAANTGLGGLRTDLPLGWTLDKAGKPQWPAGGLLVVVGWLVTALAAMMGAPFWFDALSRLVPMRANGKPPAKSSDLPAASGVAVTAAAAQGSAAPAPAADSASDGSTGARNDFESAQLTELDLLALQRALGLPPEAVTGRLDASTRAALTHWQEQNNRPGTGVFDEAAVMALLYP